MMGISKIKLNIVVWGLAFVFLFAVFCMGGTHADWDGTKWDITSPDINQPIGNDYKEIYDLRKGVAIRMNKEHETLATASAGGVHKQGSARAFFQDAAPATQVNGDAFDSGDLGSLWFDSNASPDNQFNVLTATTPTWTPISTEIIATLLASNRQFAGTLTVDGATTLTGAVGAAASITLGAGADLNGSSTSDITINTNKFTVAGDTGNTVIAGTASVGGTLTITGVATLGDASKLATAAAPTDPCDIVNMEYADTKEAILATQATASIFGTRTFNDTTPAALVQGTVYKAECDGFLTVSSAGGDGTQFTVYIEQGDATPDVVVGLVEFNANYDSASTFTIIKDDYVTLTRTLGSAAIDYMSFVPIGTGGLVAQ